MPFFSGYKMFLQFVKKKEADVRSKSDVRKGWIYQPQQEVLQTKDIQSVHSGTVGLAS